MRLDQSSISPTKAFGISVSFTDTRHSTLTVTVKTYDKDDAFVVAMNRNGWVQASQLPVMKTKEQEQTVFVHILMKKGSALFGMWRADEKNRFTEQLIATFAQFNLIFPKPVKRKSLSSLLNV